MLVRRKKGCHRSKAGVALKGATLPAEQCTNQHSEAPSLRNQEPEHITMLGLPLLRVRALGPEYTSPVSATTQTNSPSWCSKTSQTQHKPPGKIGMLQVSCCQAPAAGRGCSFWGLSIPRLGISQTQPVSARGEQCPGMAGKGRDSHLGKKHLVQSF